MYLLVSDVVSVFMSDFVSDFLEDYCIETFNYVAHCLMNTLNKQIYLWTFTSGLDILDVKAVKEMFECASNELTAFCLVHNELGEDNERANIGQYCPICDMGFCFQF